MEFSKDQIRLYTVNIDYIKYLYGVDSEVYYDTSSDNYQTKPYVGIIITQNNYNYFIPLTSAKERHKEMKNTSDNHFLIYEMLSIKEMMCQNTENWAFKIIEGIKDKPVKHILSVLDLRKMIPVPPECFSKIDIDNMSDDGRKRLLTKEYHFLKPLKEKIIKKASNLYTKQKETGVVFQRYCDFKLLEEACDKYIKS